MDYTPNHHLPQWDENDRVLRTDFNNAMACLEDSLSRSDSATGHLNEILLNLGRDNYRAAVREALNHGRFALEDSVWVNPLATHYYPGGDECGWNGHYGISRGPDCIATEENITNSAKEVSYIEVDNGGALLSNRAAVTFSGGGYGILNTITLWSWMNGNYTWAQDFDSTLYCTRLDTNEVIKAIPFHTQSDPTRYIFTQMQIELPLEENVSYRLEYSMPKRSEFYGQMGFLLATTAHGYKTVPPFTLSIPELPDTIATTLSVPEYVQGAVGIVRWIGSVSPGLSVNGNALPVIRSRSALNAEGESCIETEFSLEQIPEGELTLALVMSTSNGSFTIFDYGLIWK